MIEVWDGSGGILSQPTVGCWCLTTHVAPATGVCCSWQERRIGKVPSPECSSSSNVCGVLPEAIAHAARLQTAVVGLHAARTYLRQTVRASAGSRTSGCRINTRHTRSAVPAARRRQSIRQGSLWIQAFLYPGMIWLHA
jgi:hypothetical protein